MCEDVLEASEQHFFGDLPGQLKKLTVFKKGRFAAKTLDGRSSRGEI